MASSAVSATDALERARAAGRRAVLVTLAAGARAKPDAGAGSGTGTAIVVGDDGQRWGGTLGVEELDDAAGELASTALSGGATRRRQVPDPADPATSVELVAEVHEPRPTVWVLGATEVGRALVRLVRALPGEVTLVAPGGAVDVPGGAAVRADQPPRVLLAAPPGPADAVVLCDARAGWALESLRVALATGAAYVGAAADDAQARLLHRHLSDAGVPEAHLAALRCPAGWPLDAAEPGEVALAALHEAVAARRDRGHRRHDAGSPS